MSSSNEGFDLDLMDRMVRESIKSHIETSEKNVLEDYVLDTYDQNNRLYAKLREWKNKVPQDYIESLGIDHDWESSDIFEWLDMFIQFVQVTSDLNYIDMGALADMETAQPEAYKHVLSFRKKWAEHKLGYSRFAKTFLLE
ncbi:hypothetical protein [Pseudoalteromonas maricaloris]|uniref:hypothetical protein n=1 Tax=Pseudoalteromonas maricaloris TaxID=184924 RepID=UPI003C257887